MIAGAWRAAPPEFPCWAEVFAHPDYHDQVVLRDERDVGTLRIIKWLAIPTPARLAALEALAEFVEHGARLHSYECSADSLSSIPCDCGAREVFAALLESAR